MKMILGGCGGSSRRAAACPVNATSRTVIARILFMLPFAIPLPLQQDTGSSAVLGARPQLAHPDRCRANNSPLPPRYRGTAANAPRESLHRESCCERARALCVE